MRIAIVGTGGVTPVYRSWPEYLQAHGLHQRGHDVITYAYLQPKSPLMNMTRQMVHGIRVRRVPGTGWLSTDLAKSILLSPKPDVVHIHHLNNRMGFQAAWMFKARGVPVVLVPIGPFHDPFLVQNRDYPLDGQIKYSEIVFNLRGVAGSMLKGKPFKPAMRNLFMHAPLRIADAVIASSEHERSVLQKLGVEDHRISSIPEGVDVAEATAPPSHDFKLRRPVILFIGQLKYRKGFDVLAKAMPSIVRQYPEATWVVVSHSPIHKDDLLRLAQEGGVAQNLHLIGEVSEEEKYALYQSADVLVLPTRYEGFGLPVIEAMATGCPVVTTDVPAVNEIVTDGLDGLLVPRDDSDALATAVLRILGDMQLAARLSTNGRKTVDEKYTKDIVVDKLLTLYNSLLVK